MKTEDLNEDMYDDMDDEADVASGEVVEMRGLDLLDVIVAGGLAVVTSAWAFLWPYPYPHPNLWKFLADFGQYLPLTALSVAGKMSLGLFSGLIYLVVRGMWIRFRDEDDVGEDKFFFTRFCPLCGALIFAFAPPAWRAAQFLTPGFALLVISVFAVFIWQLGCGYRNVILFSGSYLLFAFVAGVTPLGFATIAYIGICDSLRRWQSKQALGDRDDDAIVQGRRSIELTLSIACGFIGFIIAIYVAAQYYSNGIGSRGFFSMLLSWGNGWLAAGNAVTRSIDILLLVVGLLVTAGLMAYGRRLRSFGQPVRAFTTLLASILAVITLVVSLRAIDGDERLHLALMRDYVRTTINDVKDVKWLFTDGRFDDALKFEMKRRGMRVNVLSALLPPTKAESSRLRMMAPEIGDMDAFAAGGAEVLKAWARERPDRLTNSAWQVGMSIVRRYGKTPSRTAGSVVRMNVDARKAEADEADKRFVNLSKAVANVVEHSSAASAVFGTVDPVVMKRFDEMIWRMARLSGERFVAATDANMVSAADEERKIMHTLDAGNGTLREQIISVEQLLPTSNLILTPKESLQITLKRADFSLAKRYAEEVLVSSPDDIGALFALGMANLQDSEYFKASMMFERLLVQKPNEPATLNNLALAYWKLGNMEKARETIDKALKLNPTNREIQRNKSEIYADKKPAKDK